MQKWDKDGKEEPLNLPSGAKCVVPWFDDESIYYANDRQHSQWVHENSSPPPWTKGEGVSEMVGDLFSPDFRFLRSVDGTRAARVIWKPGKNHDGYFTSDEFLAHVNASMDILESDYPNMIHLLIFDNVPNHLKRPKDALSARKMPKFTPAPGNNWGIEVSKRDANGKMEHGLNGKPIKIKIKMRDTFHNGKRQSLYFEEGHPRAGVFKGMAVILEERSYKDALKIRAECPKFKCPPDVEHCCCRQLLHNELDFVHMKTLLEELCEKRGFLVLILPKYHCELNPIEMIWGQSKFHYWQYPPSKKEDDLVQNVENALAAVTIDEMRR